MSIQDLGSIGDLVGSVATIATLIYLAVQLRQNTRALQSQTIQQICSQMGQNVENISVNRELAEIAMREFSEPGGLDPVELLRLQGLMVTSLRRLEAVYVQRHLGAIDAEMMEGFEKSLLPTLMNPTGAQWWSTAKQTFCKAFVDHVDQRLSSGDIAEQMPSMPGPANTSNA